MLRPLRQMLERLEDRAMLSLSHGPMPYGFVGEGPHPHGGGQHYADPAPHVQNLQHSVGYGPQSFAGEREFYQGFGVLNNGPGALGPYAPLPRTGFNDRGWSPIPAWDHDFDRLPPEPLTNTAAAISAPLGNPALKPAVTNPQQSQSANPHYDTQLVDHYFELDYLGRANTPWGAVDVFALREIVPDTSVSHVVSGKAQGGNQSSTSLNATNYNANANLSAADVYALARSLTDSSPALQNSAQNVDAAAFLSTTAREVAFQDFVPQLFSTTSSATYERTSAGSLAVDAAQLDGFDGFIQPREESVVDDAARSTEVITKEREAISDVLNDLRDIDGQSADVAAAAKLPVDEQTDTDGLDSELDGLQSDLATDELPAGEVDGGMVLLKSTRDVNDTGFDLAPVNAEHLERFDIQSGMETSVGLYQAVDVAIDEAPEGDNADSNDKTTESDRDNQSEQAVPTKGETSTEKAAALIGATTLTGALLWISRNSRDSQTSTTGKNRHTYRG